MSQEPNDLPEKLDSELEALLDDYFRANLFTDLVGGKIDIYEYNEQTHRLKQKIKNPLFVKNVEEELNAERILGCLNRGYLSPLVYEDFCKRHQPLLSGNRGYYRSAGFENGWEEVAYDLAVLVAEQTLVCFPFPEHTEPHSIDESSFIKPGSLFPEGDDPLIDDPIFYNAGFGGELFPKPSDTCVATTKHHDLYGRTPALRKGSAYYTLVINRYLEYLTKKGIEIKHLSFGSRGAEGHPINNSLVIPETVVNLSVDSTLIDRNFKIPKHLQYLSLDGCCNVVGIEFPRELRAIGLGTNQFRLDELPLRFRRATGSRNDFGRIEDPIVWHTAYHTSLDSRPFANVITLEEAIQKAFPDRPEAAFEALKDLDLDIINMRLVTTATYSGATGGLVGRIEAPFSERGKSYVFKAGRDFLDMYKAVVAPYKIHELAQEDELAASLARRIPYSIFPQPFQHSGLAVGLFEDVSKVNPIIEQEAMRSMDPALKQGLNPTLVYILHTTAMYHEVMGRIYKMEKAMEQSADVTLFSPGIVPTNLPRAELLSRFEKGNGTYLDLQNSIRRMLQSYDEDIAELAEHEKGCSTVGIFDNKTANWVNGRLVDFGFTKLGDEVDDLARPFMDRMNLAQPAMVGRYVNAYVQMRQAMNPEYQPGRELKRLVWKQLGFDALRNAGNVIQSPEQRAQFEAYFSVARSVLLDSIKA